MTTIAAKTGFSPFGRVISLAITYSRPSVVSNSIGQNRTYSRTRTSMGKLSKQCRVRAHEEFRRACIRRAFHSDTSTKSDFFWRWAYRNPRFAAREQPAVDPRPSRRRWNKLLQISRFSVCIGVLFAAPEASMAWRSWWLNMPMDSFAVNNLEGEGKVQVEQGAGFIFLFRHISHTLQICRSKIISTASTQRLQRRLSNLLY